MSNLWAMRGIKKMLMDKRLNKPRLKHRSYQLKSRSWMRQLTAKGNRIERLEDERDELVSALKSLDECYCQVGHEMSRDDRINHRKTLIHVRDLIKRIEGGAA